MTYPTQVCPRHLHEGCFCDRERVALDYARTLRQVFSFNFDMARRHGIQLLVRR